MFHSRNETASIPKRERTIHIQDGEETLYIRVREYPGEDYRATDLARPDLAEGYGFSEMSAMADLFAKLPRAESEREECDMMAARFDHVRDHAKNYQAAE